MNTSLNHSLKRIERLITRPAESLDDPEERQAEFRRRLKRTRQLMAHLGNPQDAFDLIHIGGTSGKGSVAILCEAMLHALGQHVGTHTSPYLQTPLEKARVDGWLIGLQDAIVLTNEVMEAVEAVEQEDAELGHPHYAEAWLGFALRHFADQRCNAAVIEVGMGGRFDATNIVMPRVSVISTVHYDHMRVLGDTLSEIAYHKAGIIKPHVPVVVGNAPHEALTVIRQEARRQSAPLIRLGHEVRYEPLQSSQQGGRFNYYGLGMQLEDVHLGLLGRYQFINATAALAAVELFASELGIALDEAALRRGLAEARFAGRMEVVQDNPRVVLDGAHNEEKINALIASVPEVFTYRRLILVLGMLETKAADPIVGALARLADAVITSSPQVKGKPALPADELARIARKAGVREVWAEDDPHAALERALGVASSGDLVLATGSLYLIGALRSRWHPTERIIEQRTMFCRPVTIHD